MAEHTAERTVQRDAGGAGSGLVREADHLFLVLEGARPLAGGARLSLEGVDEVQFRRGSARTIERRVEGERRVVTLKMPDALFSSKHARLVRQAGAGGEWTLKDDDSTNGTFVRGVRIHTHAMTDDCAFEMGAAHFVLRAKLPTPENAAIDVESENLIGRAYGIASLVPEGAEALGALARVATSPLSILLLGESGSGKEVLAGAVHRLSGRSGPLVAVNCGGLTSSLLESQLFGHTRGAFSGAVRDELGFVRASDKGTLFLDEIGDMPPPSQAALLRVLETREVTPVGSTKAVPVDLRVVSATLKSASALRPDLHARLAGYTHMLTPLRERREDLGMILAELLTKLAGARAKTVRLSPEAGRVLVAHGWPLNARELAQALGVALVLATNDCIEAQHLPASVHGGVARAPVKGGADDAPDSAPSKAPSKPPPPIPRDEGELKAMLVSILQAHKGNISEVSRALGKTRMQIHRWMRRFDIDPTTFRT